MSTYTTRQDVIDQLVIPSLGEHADGFDVEAIAAAITEWVDGKLAVTAEGDDFWAIAQQHDVMGTIRELHEQTVAADVAADEIRRRRDVAIRAAIRDGRTMYAIAQETRLSEQAVARIRDRG